MNRAKPRFAALLLIFTSLWCLIAHADTAAVQTNVDQARHSTDDAGVPHLTISGVGKVDHPAWTALYALAYAGVEDYDPGLGLKADPQRFEASIAWLKANLTQNERGLWVWTYNFDSTYNDVSIKAPWSSAFAQATGIQALVAHWRKTQDPSSLELARKAAESLFVPLSEGGFLFSAGDDIWFEEIPSPVENPSHILNGHMRALLALNELKEATGEDLYQQWFGKGTDTLLRWLPLYDAGYWLRYDLNPRKDELLFRLANPYGFANPELAIDRIVLRDPESGEESVLDVGGANDAEGPLRIAGNDWGQIEEVGGRSVRRLRPTEGERETLGSEGQMVAPYSYFYLALPGKWQNNLRKEGFELTIEYLDEKSGNLEIQMRSLSPARETFKKLKDSDLLISGKEDWRQWKINLYPSDLGYWVGETYAHKHAQYLNKLAQLDQRLAGWADAAFAYLRALETGKNFKVVIPKRVELPSQTPMLPVHTLDKGGVVTQWKASDKTTYYKDGSYNPDSDPGEPVHSPFIIARQLLAPDEVGQGGYKNPDKNQVTSLAALNWFLSDHNQFKLGNGALTYHFDFDNTYNDIVTAKGWASAFSQAYVLKALGHALDTKLGNPAKVAGLLKQVAYGYNVPIEKGGIVSISKSGLSYFEEVPNSSHVLNAHLISIIELVEAERRLREPKIGKSVESGLQTLRAKLSDFDTGYWMRYDLNPKKELLFQLDWLSGDESPLIEEISLEAPQFAKRNRLYVGSEQAFDGATRISGLEWSPIRQVDGRPVRAFANGYLLHKEAIQGGTRHNAYALMQLPQTTFSDYFDVQSHHLVVRYKDVAAGQFVVKLQSINEGNMLDFIPLRNAVITTIGDQQWKEAVIEVRPQDMGWYKGADYQVFEVEQLEQIAKLTGDWFFEQYAERQRYFLEAKAKGKPVIVQPAIEEGMTPVGLSILQSSPTYEGFGFENALDGDPNDDYVAGQEGQADEYVELALDRPVSHASLGLRWESRNNHASTLKVFALDTGGARRQLVSVSIKNGEDIELKLNATQPFQHVRIEFAKPVGQPRVLLREIKLESGSKKQSDSKAPASSENVVFLPANDAKNPLGIFRLPITNSIKHLSDRLIFEPATAHEKIISLMSFMHDFEIGIPFDTSPDGIINEKKGACGNFTVLLLALAASQGYEGRVINLYNYPEAMGHTVAEIFTEGQWRLYDPTFEGFYVDVDELDIGALSFEQILEGYKQGRRIEYRHRKNRAGIELFTGQNVFLHSDPKGVIGPDKRMLFPLSLDMRGAASITAENFGTKFQGASYVGAAYVNQSQAWKLKGLVRGKHYSFNITPSGIGGDLQPGDSFTLIAELKGDRRSRRYEPSDYSSWEIAFVAESNEENITLTHDYVGDRNFYLSFSGFSLLPK